MKASELREIAEWDWSDNEASNVMAQAVLVLLPVLEAAEGVYVEDLDNPAPDLQEAIAAARKEIEKC